MPAQLVYLFHPMNKHPDPEDLPNRVRSLRKARKMSARELGERIGLTGMMIGHLETGRRELKYPQMRAIARELDVKVSDLLIPEDQRIFPTADIEALIGDYLSLDAKDRRAVRGLADNLRSYRTEPAANEIPTEARTRKRG